MHSYAPTIEPSVPASLNGMLQATRDLSDAA